MQDERSDRERRPRKIGADALGVGQERALGVPWERRGKRMDECMDILRGLTGGGFFGYDGEFYSFPPLKQCPAPTEPIPLPRSSTR